MAHELDFVETAEGKKARMFYCGDLPWHGLGQKLDGAATWEQAVTAAHLDYEVGMIPLHYNRGDAIRSHLRAVPILRPGQQGQAGVLRNADLRRRDEGLSRPPERGSVPVLRSYRGGE